MYQQRVLGLLTCLGLLSAAHTNAAELVEVHSVPELTRAAAQARAGTVIQVAPGSYELTRPIRLSAAGTATQPVVIRTRTAGSVKFGGEGVLSIENSSWLTLEGFVLEYGARPFVVRGSDHVRLTRLAVHYKLRRTEADVRTDWIHFMDGEGHRVDHCDIGPRSNDFGVTLRVDNDTSGIRIDHNYFHDRMRAKANGAETIRLGTDGSRAVNATVENNLFENCDGEIEIVSVKSSGNTIRANTFRDNRGQLVVRTGNDVTIADNQFIATRTDKAVGGIRAHGKGIRIVNNYFQNIRSSILTTFAGDEQSNEAFGARRAAYPQTLNLSFVGNLVVDGKPAEAGPGNPTPAAAAISLGENERATQRPFPPKDWTIAHNVFVLSRPLMAGGGGAGFSWSGNVAWNESGDVRLPEGLTKDTVAIRNPSLVRSDDVWRLPDGGTTSKTESRLPRDRKQLAQLTPKNLPRPLAPADVGPMSSGVE